MKKRYFLSVLFLIAACSGVYNGSATDLPLVGTVPSTADLPHLNRYPVTSYGITFGPDGVPWTIFTEAFDATIGLVRGFRAVRLEEPRVEDEVIGTNLLYGATVIYIFDADLSNPTAPKVKLRLHELGRAKDEEFLLDGKLGLFLPGPYDRLFTYLPGEKGTAYVVQARDKSFTRMIPLPEGITSEKPVEFGYPFYTVDGDYLLIRDGTGHLKKYPTQIDGPAVDLGLRPKTIVLEDRETFLTCGTDGLRRAWLDGRPDQVLSAAACDETQGIGFHNDDILFVMSGPPGFDSRYLQQWRIPSDGSGPATPLLQQGRFLLNFGPSGELVYTLDPEDRYIHGVGDGWLNDWKFMERGRSVSFTVDKKSLVWLEHAAQNSAVGDLTAAQIPSGAPRLLARNVNRYTRLSDGRIVACANRAFRGVQNRVIVINKELTEARWVASQASDYAFIPGSSDMLIAVFTGPQGADIVRVPLPAAE